YGTCRIIGRYGIISIGLVFYSEETAMKNIPQGSRGAAYLRVSDGGKQELDSQRASIDAYLKANGLTVQTFYEDSGSRDLPHKRPSFQRMMKAVEAGRYDFILVDHRDRLGGIDHIQFCAWAHVMREAGCQLWSVSQGDLLATDLGAQVLAVVDSEASAREQQ